MLLDVPNRASRRNRKQLSQSQVVQLQISSCRDAPFPGASNIMYVRSAGTDRSFKSPAAKERQAISPGMHKSAQGDACMLGVTIQYRVLFNT